MTQIKITKAWDSFELNLNDCKGDDSESSAALAYIIEGAADEVDACEKVWDEAPEEYNDILKRSVSVSERLGEQTWRVEVQYGEDKSTGSSMRYKDEDDPTVSFDCGGGTKHLLYSLDQRRAFGDKDAGGAIGWNGKSGDDCEIAGVDVPTAQLRETYTRQMRVSRLTTAFKRKVASLVGKVNSSYFKGWNPGEVMFLGMSYSTPPKKARKVTVTFNFAIQPNETVRICGRNISKKGFEYVWALSKTQASGGVPQVKVDAIYVDQVCESASFSPLGL